MSQTTSLSEWTLDTVRRLEITFKDELIRVTTSPGIARLRHGQSSSQWIERANTTLYGARQGGRDCIVLSQEDEDRETGTPLCPRG